tara:strand:+ start:242 stop:565 length:324 start_codon:yes stop_codon:yes gene_type:complete
MTTKTKNEVTIDGKKQMVDDKVYAVMQNLSEALRSHEVALLTWVHKIYSAKKRHNEDEKGLYKYCMTIPGASDILNRMTLIDEENEKKRSDGSSDKVGTTESNGTVN